jgi:hypothetical protein
MAKDQAIRNMSFLSLGKAAHMMRSENDFSYVREVDVWHRPKTQQ